MSRLRVVWESPDVDRAATRLGRVLGVEPSRRADDAGGVRFALGDAEIQVLPRTHPSRDDLLRFDDDNGNRDDDVVQTQDDGQDDAVPTRAPGAGGSTLVGVAVGTVDSARYAEERGWQVREAPRDRILGAYVSLVAEHPRVLLVEPSTEGRSAAALARYGEGPVALYVWTPRPLRNAWQALGQGGGAPSVISTGPFGQAFAVGQMPIWGPHLLVVGEREPVPVTGTIAP